MKFHCTLVCSPGSELQKPPVELTIQAPEGTSGAEVNAQLIRRFGTGAVSVGGEDIQSMRVGEAPLVSGSILVDGALQQSARPRPRRPPADEGQLALAVHSGVGAGTVVPLRRGAYTIGRSGTRVVIPDPELSRQHARLVVTETDIMIMDLDSANGIYVDGQRVRNALVSTESSISCGNTTMSLVFMDLTEKALVDAGISTQLPLIVPGRTDTGNRALLLLTAALPLLIGVGLAVLTGMWMFLAFSAASAVSVLVPLAAGRRQSHDLAHAAAAAVAKDRERRRRSGPSLALLVLAAGHKHSSGDPAPDDGRVWLRLGEAPQPANVKIEPAASAVSIPSVGTVPVTLDPSLPVTIFRGSGPVVDGIIRSLVMQLAGYPRGRGTRIVIHGEAHRLPLGARYLPGVTLVAPGGRILQILNEGFEPVHQRGVLLVVGSANEEEDDADAVRGTATARGWQILQFLTPEESADTSDVLLSERASLLRCATGDVTFVPDLAPEEVFMNFCRRFAGSPGPGDKENKCVPTTCSLQDVLALTPEKTSDRWDASARNPGLQVPLGLSSSGARFLDLEADGPHLLVAGTTGSGKSELLRSLALALALSHPPDRVTFLFIDFKGGSGLGPLTELVHCVGLLTDLSSYELERTLTSLRAEIRLREEALASAKVPDLAAYPAGGSRQDLPLPHLVIVIDEFRMLVDDAPEVLRELMRIAAIGRSLGIHLIMATQRPQGAITADIRANVTSSIALRVQSGMESVDIISTKDAADIRVETPGRAFLARGTEDPLEFQTASLGSARVRPGRVEAVTVQLAADYLESAGTGNDERGDDGRGNPEGRTPAEAAVPLVALVRELWSERKGRAPRRPVATPLPSHLPAPEGEDTPGTSSGINGRGEPSIGLGLLDLPEKQRVVPLVWKPTEHSHLAFIGTPSSGAEEALHLAVMQLLLNPFEAHGYILDAGGTLLGLSSDPRVGAHSGMHELRRAVRVLERIKEELARRLGQSGGHREVPLVLVISGWGSWVSAFRAGPLAWAEDLVQDLARDGSRAGIVVMISGDRELVSSKVFSACPNRLYFPAGSNLDSRIAWPRMPATAELKGRAVAFGHLTGGGPAVCQLYVMKPHSQRQSGQTDQVEKSLTQRPFRVEQLPALVPAKKIQGMALSGRATGALQSPGRSKLRPVSRRPSDILMGVGGDELKPVSFRLLGGGVFAVLGGPGSGKTSFLRALPLMNPEGGPWLQPGDGDDACEFWERALATAAEGEGFGRTVALVDGADLLSPEAQRNLSELNALGHPVILTANYSPLLLQRVPLVMNARSAGSALLLAPRSMVDGDLFGVRFEVETSPPPGRGVFISPDSAAYIQVGWVPASAEETNA